MQKLNKLYNDFAKTAYYIVILILGIIGYSGFSKYTRYFQQKETLDFFNLIITTIIFTIAIGTFVETLRIDGRYKKCKRVQQAGRIIFISGLLMLFGLALLGFSLSPDQNEFTNKIGILIFSAGLMFLFIGLSYLSFGMLEVLFTESKGDLIDFIILLIIFIAFCIFSWEKTI